MLIIDKVLNGYQHKEDRSNPGQGLPSESEKGVECFGRDGVRQKVIFQSRRMMGYYIRQRISTCLRHSPQGLNVRKQEFPGKVRAATNVTATRLAATDFITYNFTEITITTPPLTRILDHLIRGGIILCGDVV